MTQTISDDVLGMLDEAEKDFKTKLTVIVNQAELDSLDKEDSEVWDQPLMPQARTGFQYIDQKAKGDKLTFTYGSPLEQSEAKSLLDKALKRMKELTPSVKFTVA